MSRVRVRDRWCRTPRKGTLARTYLLLAMRPQGATLAEMLEAAGRDPANLAQRATAASMLQSLPDLTGWDVRTCPCPKERGVNHGGRRPMVYRIEGRMGWRGGYRRIVR